MSWHSRRPNASFVLRGIAAMAAFGLSTIVRAEASWFHRTDQPAARSAANDQPQPSQDPAFRIAAHVDRSTVDIGQQFTLTISLEGDLTRATLRPFEFPPAFAVVAQQRASNVAINAGRMTRSISLIYVLVPREAGTFQLGPFQILHREESVGTEPIHIIVKKPVLPPHSDQEPRFTL